MRNLPHFLRYFLYNILCNTRVKRQDLRGGMVDSKMLLFYCSQLLLSNRTMLKVQNLVLRFFVCSTRVRYVIDVYMTCFILRSHFLPNPARAECDCFFVFSITSLADSTAAKFISLNRCKFSNSNESSL